MKKNSQPSKRKTLDERLGIVGIASVAVIGMFIFQPIANVCGLTAVYLLVKRRNDKTVPKRTKVFGWVLVIVWLFLVLLIVNSQTNAGV
ncbi:MAG: hypothetical protein COZ34_02410 [Candidatus Pacebacteria bacterium CG_4_10_14_3_um_filter_34_15]|nr:hypothetical protein [Candidatus Paceibacterota bacterium]OIO44897.1 MAG: hypothetical protein AUJ41_01415 [Candidatus Pacebacteria bacterium CG1_02_43_31]PIQ80527.1 MAG: hypothetical protein COV78_05010 [Candidatus Pacebacteria bacterium CG11_big_fil_rev_8_21_14_0_20_34_55]PIX81572.1 MAG: hypothetical protein COZ34_02410 [Candidatus Pacebacteria bacterium CG_4_10_14_3_um_filter_34_15]PJC44163.1 MAG: hypothetical protein CO039_00165 [Candidatus Pacebacteria bacterium CG_4_9_14_0_2_um_filter_